jgi:hypothetical protein
VRERVVVAAPCVQRRRCCAAARRRQALLRSEMASRSVLVEEAHVPPHFDNLLQRRVPYEARACRWQRRSGAHFPQRRLTCCRVRRLAC